jgi:hypothetical protein
MLPHQKTYIGKIFDFLRVVLLALLGILRKKDILIGSGVTNLCRWRLSHNCNNHQGPVMVGIVLFSIRYCETLFKRLCSAPRRFLPSGILEVLGIFSNKVR